MDKTSPVFENFENKMAAMQGQGRPKINRSTFKIGGSGLEKRVANNEKKITTLKNIFKAQKVQIGEKITPKINVLEDSLISTNFILADVADQLQKDFSSRLNAQKALLAKEKENKLDRKREDKEGRLEVKKIGKIATSIGNTVVKPFKSILDKLLDFGKLFLAGVGVNAALTWLSDPQNMARFTSILKAIQEKPFIALGTLGGALFIINKTIGKFGNILKKFVGGMFKLIFTPKKFITEFGPQLIKTGKKIANETPLKFVLGKVGQKVAKKTGLKIFGAIPVIGDLVDLGVAIYRFSQGDIAGGFLSLGSAIPFAGWGFAALDIAREFNAPFTKDSILDKSRFDKTKKNRKDGGPFSKGETIVFNEETPIPIEFNALSGGKVMTADQMERVKGLRRNRGGLNLSQIIDLPVQDLRTKKGQVQQMQPGGDSVAGAPTYYPSIDGTNPYISEFNTMVEIGEKV